MSVGKENVVKGGFTFDYDRKPKKCSYGGIRSKSSIKAVALHWTSGVSDTSRNECDFFATGNTRNAGAHFFIDRDGKVGRSVRMNRIAWSVMSRGYLSGAYDGIYDNTNTVSIELCGLATNGGGCRMPSPAQLDALYRLLAWLKKYCPNCTDFIRHFDVKQKPCPAPYVEDVEAWKKLRKKCKNILVTGKVV